MEAATQAVEQIQGMPVITDAAALARARNEGRVFARTDADEEAVGYAAERESERLVRSAWPGCGCATQCKGCWPEVLCTDEAGETMGFTSVHPVHYEALKETAAGDKRSVRWGDKSVQVDVIGVGPETNDETVRAQVKRALTLWTDPEAHEHTGEASAPGKRRDAARAWMAKMGTGAGSSGQIPHRTLALASSIAEEAEHAQNESPRAMGSAVSEALGHLWEGETAEGETRYESERTMQAMWRDIAGNQLDIGRGRPEGLDEGGMAIAESLEEALVKGDGQGLDQMGEALRAREFGEDIRAELHAMRTHVARETTRTMGWAAQRFAGKPGTAQLRSIGRYARELAARARATRRLAIGFGRRDALTRTVRKIAHAGPLTIDPDTGAARRTDSGAGASEPVGARGANGPLGAPGGGGALGRAMLLEIATERMGWTHEEARAALDDRHGGADALRLSGGQYDGARRAVWGRTPARERIDALAKAHDLTPTEAIAVERAFESRCLDAWEGSVQAKLRESALEACGAGERANAERTVRCARTALGVSCGEGAGPNPAKPGEGVWRTLETELEHALARSGSAARLVEADVFESARRSMQSTAAGGWRHARVTRALERGAGAARTQARLIARRLKRERIAGGRSR